MDFTVLQSVYYKDDSEYLDMCFESIYKNTVQPKEIILVKDGNVSNEIEGVIEKWKEKLHIQTVGYCENKGLTYALNYGLQYVSTELVARMDSDDVCCVDRFEKQLVFLNSNPKIAILSGYIEEFDNNPEEIRSIRKVPLDNDSIHKYLKKRNAFNHMAVMFKKSVIVDVGGYQNVPYFEDYDLWIRVVQKGYTVANIPDCLVKARVGNDMIGRRHGFAYAKHEIFFLKRQFTNNFITFMELVRLIFLRVPIRLVPKKILQNVYKLLRG